METKTKQNGTVKRQTATVKTEVQKKLTNEAIGKTVVTEKKATIDKPSVSLDDRIQKFEKLRGLATQRERLTQTLNELTKFNTIRTIRAASIFGIHVIWNSRPPTRT